MKKYRGTLCMGDPGIKAIHEVEKAIDQKKMFDAAFDRLEKCRGWMD